MVKISELAAATTMADGDLFEIERAGGTSSNSITKANVLKEVKQSISDGSGIGPKAVKASNLDFSTGIWWEELGRSDTPSGNSLIVNIATPKKYMKVIARTSNSQAATQNQFMRLNNDAGSNYRTLYADSGNNTGTTSAPLFYADNGSAISVAGSVRQFEFMAWDLEISKPATGTWATCISTVTGDGRYREYKPGLWKNTVSLVTQVRIDGAAGINGELIVLGHD